MSEEILVLAQSNGVVLVIHSNYAICGIHRPDGHLIVLGVGLNLSGYIGNLPGAVDSGQVLVRAAEGVLEVNSDGNELSLIAYSWVLVVVGLSARSGYPWTGK